MYQLKKKPKKPNKTNPTNHLTPQKLHILIKSTSPLDKYIWNSCTVHSGIKFSDCLSAWKYLISKKIPELGEENPLSEFCTWANAQVLAGIRSLDPWETSSISGLQITSQGMEDKKNSKVHFPAMRTEWAVEQESSPIHLDDFSLLLPYPLLHAWWYVGLGRYNTAFLFAVI